MKNHRGARLRFDLSALQHNYRQVKKHAPHAHIMPVIKANAYGHGVLQVAQCLSETGESDAHGFAVAQLGEAVFLREHGIDKPITVLQGFLNTAQLDLMHQYALRPAMSQLWQIDLLASYSSELSLDVWLKINTGMWRLGVALNEVESCYQRLNNMAGINDIGFMMHFANADEPHHPSNQQQQARFLSALPSCSTVTSLSNSAAIVSGLVKQQDWLRPGIMLYGASPLQGKSAADLNLKPVMQVHAQLIAINQLKKGDTVGYGDTWCCPEDMPVGIVNIGYGDGYPRHAQAAPFSINGQRCQLIGRVSMDSLAIDLRGIQGECGVWVECWGEHISVDEVAASANTIAYELLCNMGRGG